jgi:hypothetical protein
MSGRKLPSRRDALRHGTAGVVCTLAAAAAPRLACATAGGPAAEDTAEMRPQDAFRSVLDAMKRFPLVAIGEDHQLQEWHDFITALLFRPELSDAITDVVVEFGNALYQDVADRFVVEDQPVADGELQRMWRFTIGGGVLWDAPVYAQFFRSVRAVNWMRSRTRRLRVLLGDPPFDHRKVRGTADRDYVLSTASQRDEHYGAVVRKEVLEKGRRALLLAGTGHVLRGGRVRGHSNAVSLLEQSHPGRTFVIVPVRASLRADGEGGKPNRRSAIARWPRPSIAALAGTWLGDTDYRATGAPGTAGARPDAKADAVLFLGPDEVLTRSCAEPSIFQVGDYRAELERLSKITGLRDPGDPTPAGQPGPRKP